SKGGSAAANSASSSSSFRACSAVPIFFVSTPGYPRVVSSQQGEERDGATLVYPGVDTKKIGTAEQARKEDEELAEFAAALPPLLEELAGPRVTARISSECDRCPLKPICPVQAEGK